VCGWERNRERSPVAGGSEVGSGRHRSRSAWDVWDMLGAID
jgi:hypothetical protein